MWRVQIGFARAFLFVAMARAQEYPVFRSDVSLVTIPCVVTDRNGAAVRGLAASDFRVYSDGALRKVQALWTEPELPLALGVIVDVSESQGSQRAEHESAVTEFAGRLIRPQDRGFVVHVDENVLLKSEFTGGSHGLKYRVLATARGEPLGIPCGSREGEHGRKRPICGGTALWNSVYAAAQLKLKDSPGSRTGNKVLLILSDGNDTGSTHSIDDAVEELERSGAVVYAIRYRDSLADADSSGGLDRMATATGGLVFDPASMSYPEMLNAIEADMGSRYVLAVQPGSSESDGHLHSLRVEVTRSGLSVRSRRSYFGVQP